MRRRDNRRLGFGWDRGKVLLPLPTIAPSVDAASGSLPEVLMMQTADPRHLDHLPTIR
jgi:hypothetical protein